MSVPDLCIGAPVWNRAWALPIWFDSLDANTDPERTGLIFVVPPNDQHSREVIYERSKSYAFVEVIRDRYEQFDRELRRRDNHLSLAKARNMLLEHVCGVGPEWYLSWDSDLLIAPGVLSQVMQHQKPVATVWAWLNRRAPQEGMHWDEDQQKLVPVRWNEAPNCTVMEWEGPAAAHLDPRHWEDYTRGLWRCDVVLAWQLMHKPVYTLSRYGPHPHGEDIPFNWHLHQRGIERWCYGQSPGVHLFDKETALREIEEGYPAIMRHAQDKPLAAYLPQPESDSLRTIGYFERDPAPT